MKKLIILIAFISCFQLISQDFELIVKNKIDHVSVLAREPMVAEHPNGTLFVTGYRNQADVPQLWKSTDGGKNWEQVNVGSYEDGAQGNSDVDLFIDKEGNIYFLCMTYTKVPEDRSNFDFSTLKGQQITLGVSRDVGKTWKWQHISKNDYDDRPWITSTTNGDLHIIWNDGSGIFHSISKDKGETWQSLPKVFQKGGSSFLANGPNGQLAVRVSPLSASGVRKDKEVDMIRFSPDNGNTWTDVTIPGKRTWNQDNSGVPRWVEPIAFDEENRLYLLWSEGKEMKLGVSVDNGESWQVHVVAESQDTIYYPYMEISGNNILCSWVSGFREKVRHHAAVLRNENKKISVYKLDAQRVDIRSRFSGGKQLSTGGEYFPIIPLSNGNFGMATPIQNYSGNRLGFTWWELQLLGF